MADVFALPSKKCVVFWPVGTGDSTTLVLRPNELVMQIDLRHLEKAERPDEAEWPIIDHLVRVLPKRNGRPYLAVFVLTHPDKDHIQGFAELLRRVDIGELWHTPKIFRDHETEGVCDDAIAFRTEAHRRREAILANPSSIRSGNRLRVVGHDDILKEAHYIGLPEACKSRPGDKVEAADGIGLAGEFQAFIHAPFKDDQAASKNNTSLSLNVVLWEGDKYGQFLFFGDRERPTITRIFTETENSGNTAYLHWDVMLASHHCSKCVMYWRDEGEDEATLKREVMSMFAKYKRRGAYIVSSSHADFTDAVGDNPPHKKARNRYEEIVDAGHFLCTHEYPSRTNAMPMIFTVGQNGVELQQPRPPQPRSNSLAAAVGQARGGSQPPSVQIGFGRRK